MSNGRSSALLNFLWCASKIYATTGRMLYYLLCKIISEFYISMRKEIDFIANNIPPNDSSKIIFVSEISDTLTKLANHNVLIAYRCVEQLNFCFGHFLFIEITYIFFAEINTAMYILEHLCSKSNNGLLIWILIMWLVYFLLNFSILCFSSHRIENVVFKTYLRVFFRMTYGI